MESKCPFCVKSCGNDHCSYGGSMSKYSKSKINRHRGTKTLSILFGDFLHELDGDLVGLEKRLWDLCVSADKKYEDGTSPKKKELYIEVDKYYDNYEVEIRSQKEVPETDEVVILRLDKQEEAAIKKAEKFRAAREKEEADELELYKLLKEKYETGEA